MSDRFEIKARPPRRIFGRFPNLGQPGQAVFLGKVVEIKDIPKDRLNDAEAAGWCQFVLLSTKPAKHDPDFTMRERDRMQEALTGTLSNRTCREILFRLKCGLPVPGQSGITFENWPTTHVSFLCDVEEYLGARIGGAKAARSYLETFPEIKFLTPENDKLTAALKDVDATPIKSELDEEDAGSPDGHGGEAVSESAPEEADTRVLPIR